MSVQTNNRMCQPRIYLPEGHNGLSKFSTVFQTLPSARFPFLLSSLAISHISYLKFKKVNLDKWKETKSTTEKYFKNGMINMPVKEEKVHQDVIMRKSA